MENPSQVSPSKLKPLLLAFAVFVVLLGGGLAIWSVTKKEDDEPTENQPNEGVNMPPVGGRPDVTSFYTEEELQHSALTNNELPDETPEYQAVLMTSDEGKQLIEDRMEKIQLNAYDVDKLRAKHLIGKNLDNFQSLSTDANKLIDKMFGLVDGVTEGNYKTYPVYGKYESKGQELRTDIDNFLSKDGQGYNLSELRHGGNRWWFGSLGLNLMYGNQKATVHSAHEIWAWKASRSGLDFFKEVNGHDVSDHELLKKVNGKGVFAAWGIYSVVQDLKKEMDRFDRITKQEAITALEREGLIRRF